MIGDLGLGGFRVYSGSGVTSTAVVSRAPAQIPLFARGAFKIAENESPRPVDRVFLTWNYFNDISTGVPPNFNMNREVAGFEKTFLDGDASFGMRLPYQQISGDGDLGSSRIGDLTFLLKYAFVNDRTTGDVLSGGLVVTTPTGKAVPGLDGSSDINPTLLQPWVGGIYNGHNFVLHGFSSVIVPTDSRDVTFWANDVGLIYWLYRGCRDDWVNFIAPTVEAHVNTPFDHRNPDGPIYMPHTVIMTGGAHLGCGRSILTIGAAIPVTGPNIFSWEGIVQFNLRF
jgi:hypothetical protein